MAESHSHDEFEVNLITSGRGTYVIDGEKHAVRARSLVWLFPEQEHFLKNFSSDFTMWIFVLSPEFAHRMAGRIGPLAERRTGSIFLKTLPLTCTRHLEGVAQELSTGFQPLDCHELGLVWWLASAWEAYEHGEANDVGPLHSAVSRAIALLHENASENLKSLARQTGLSPSRLSRLFKQQAGMSITDFRNSLRLEAFLSHHDRHRGEAMFDAAEQSGFGSYAQFSRVFRRQMGCSPENYFRVTRRRKAVAPPAV
jgi:AraC-like DNA-binding protein